MARYEPEREGRARARSVLLTVLVAEMVVLVATGVALYFVYRPAEPASWNTLAAEDLDLGVRLALALRLLHRLVAYIAVATTIAVALVARDRERARRGGLALGLGTVITALLATSTGFLLPWDQVALWAVAPGTQPDGGFGILFGDNVRFVLMGNAELTPGTVIFWLLLHMVALGPALVALVGVAGRREWVRRRSHRRHELTGL